MIKAQEAYEKTVKNIEFVETNTVLEQIGQRIEETVNLGAFVINYGPITDYRITEKVAIELEKMGYKAMAIQFPPVFQNGVQVPASGVYVNWKMLPDNTRETYN